FILEVLELVVITIFREIGLIVVIAWSLVRFIKQIEERVLKNSEQVGTKIDRTTADAIAQLLRLSVIITAGLVGLQTIGVNISAILAFGGIGGIAIGFAAKDLLSNFFGGLMIYLDRPFAIGDWVRSPDRDIEGTVEKIGWRLTIIRTFDKRPLYIPNSVFATIVVENPSRMLNRRIYETIGVRYADAAVLKNIIDEVKDMLRKHTEIDQEQTMMVNFNKFAASSLDFFVYTFTKTTNWIDYHMIKQDVLFKINEIITHHGAEIAFPTSTVHLPDATLAIADK
ncbi:MAG: mechanosensitive ion channel family protein, partial [Thioalkalispiraceae bacterium]